VKVKFLMQGRQTEKGEGVYLKKDYKKIPMMISFLKRSLLYSGVVPLLATNTTIRLFPQYFKVSGRLLNLRIKR